MLRVTMLNVIFAESCIFYCYSERRMLSGGMPSLIVLSVVMVSVWKWFYADCHYAECPYADSHYDQCRGANCLT